LTTVDGERVLTLWTIYDHPLDFPDSFVVRRWHVRRGNENPVLDGAPTLHDSLEAARESLPASLACMHRSENDDPNILETWI
jgi:hypothetical protein